MESRRSCVFSFCVLSPAFCSRLQSGPLLCEYEDMVRIHKAEIRLAQFTGSQDCIIVVLSSQPFFVDAICTHDPGF
jgi:hypothetical protein